MTQHTELLNNNPTTLTREPPKHMPLGNLDNRSVRLLQPGRQELSDDERKVLVSGAKRTAVSMMSCSVIGAVAGAVIFGPIGILIGGALGFLAGYVISECVFSKFNPQDLSKELSAEEYKEIIGNRPDSQTSLPTQTQDPQNLFEELSVEEYKELIGNRPDSQTSLPTEKEEAKTKDPNSISSTNLPKESLVEEGKEPREPNKERKQAHLLDENFYKWMNPFFDLE